MGRPIIVIMPADRAERGASCANLDGIAQGSPCAVHLKHTDGQLIKAIKAASVGGVVMLLHRCTEHGLL